MKPGLIGSDDRLHTVRGRVVTRPIETRRSAAGTFFLTACEAASSRGQLKQMSSERSSRPPIRCEAASSRGQLKHRSPSASENRRRVRGRVVTRPIETSTPLNFCPLNRAACEAASSRGQLKPTVPLIVILQALVRGRVVTRPIETKWGSACDLAWQLCEAASSRGQLKQG